MELRSTQRNWRWVIAGTTRRRLRRFFPFGFGLSYTTFKFDHLKVSPPDAGKVSISFDIMNTGEREGEEVTQVYVASPISAGEPPKQLRGFAKVSLRPRETQHIILTLDPRSFSVWSTDTKGWTEAPGTYQILVGQSSRDLPLPPNLTIPFRK